MTDTAARLPQDASMMQGATRARVSLHSGLDRIATLFALFVVLGPLVVSRIGLPGVLHLGTGTNTFFVQYRRHEPVFLVLMALFAVATAVAARWAVPDDSTSRATWFDVSGWGARQLLLAAMIVFAIAAAGGWVVMHSLPLAMDEFAASFQSQLFASGQLRASIAEPWRPVGWSLAPVYVAFDARDFTWTTQYLPVYSALRAVFVRIGADRFVNPALGAVSLPLVYACARRLWPDDKQRPWLAVAFLALSTQFLFMSMTSFAMPAHLAANLLWLYAFLRSDRAGWLAAPVIGVLALGLHNPFPHALFVAPFLLYILFQRRWAWTAYFAAIYLIGIGFWYWWAKLVSVGGSGLFTHFQRPGMLMFELQAVSLTLVFSWQTPVLGIALLSAALAWRSLSMTERLLGAGFLLSFAFFILFPSTQGHGWGYRYTYPVLGNLTLLGAAGIGGLRASFGDAFVRRAIVASALLTVLVQIPVRAWQIERYVRPFAEAHEYIHHLDADVVIVDPTSSWYGIDLVRNDPFLRDSPKVVSAFGLRRELKAELAARFGPRVHFVEPRELAQFGIPTFPSRFRNPIWP